MPGPEEARECGCGVRRALTDPAVSAEPRYGFWRSMTLLFGVTAGPKRIDYVCMSCGTVIASSSDAALLRANTH